MMERRKFPRVHLSAKSILRHKDTDYRGQLENISLSGALVRLEQCVIVSLGGEYILTIYLDGEDTPLQLFVEVVCATFSLVGLKFVSCDTETSLRLGQLVHQLSTQPDRAKVELEKIRRRFIYHLHEE
jgi:c-di-GMP-binding flagellar brake protein YcgR